MSVNDNTYEALQVSGVDGSATITIPNVGPFVTVKSLKKIVSAQVGHSAEGIRLMVRGELLDGSKALGDYDIDETTLVRWIATSDSTGAGKEETVIPPRKSSGISPKTDPAKPRDKYDGLKLESIFIKGIEGKTETLRKIPARMTVHDFFSYYAHEKANDVDNIRLLFAGKQLEFGSQDEELTLMDYGITNEATLHFVYRLKGGVTTEPTRYYAYHLS